MPATYSCAALIFSLLLTVRPCTVLARHPPGFLAPPTRDTVVDRVFLKDGTVLRGLLVSDRPVRILVRAEWLSDHAEDFLSSQLRPLLLKNTRDFLAAITMLLQQELQAAPVVPPGVEVASPIRARRALLEDLLERLSPDDPRPLPDWLLIECPRTRLLRLEQVSEKRRDLCRLGMLNRLPQLEQLPWKTVQQQLEAIPAARRILVFRGPPPVQSEDVQQHFQGILAAIDVRSGAATRVIQAGPLCVDEESPGGIPLLFQHALQQHLQRTLSELLDEVSGVGAAASPAVTPTVGSLPAEAMAMAQRRGSRTLVISSSQTDLSSGSAVVSRQVFLHSGGEWRLQFALQDQASIKDLPAERAGQLANDPQIQQLTQIVQALGIADNQLQTAVSMGSVVQEALARLEARFDEQLQWLLTARRTSTAGIPLIVLEDSALPKAGQAR